MSYHQCQLYSLSGYFYISTELTLEELIQNPAVEEWLDSYRYFIRPCPSQAEEMVKVGVSCYSSIFLFREDLKQAIMAHQDWTPANPDSSTIFDIFIGELKTSSRKNRNKKKYQAYLSPSTIHLRWYSKSIPKWVNDDFHTHGWSVLFIKWLPS